VKNSKAMRRLWMCAVAVALVMFAVPSRVSAHIVMGTTTLRLLTLASDVVARVRIVEPYATLILEDPPLRESVVVVEVLETLKGAYAEKQLRFVPRGHGAIAYERGEEVIVFVRRIERIRELANTRVAEHLHWVSEQESGAEFRLNEGNRGDIVAAIQAYVVLAALPPEAQLDALRRITIDQLRSPQVVLASSALRDLVLSANAAIVSAEDLPVLEPLLDDPATRIGIRIGLLAELERRQLIAGSVRWATLLRTTEGADRLAVVRAAGAHPSQAVANELLELLSSKDVELVSTAAVALGNLRNDFAVKPLTKLLSSEESRLRMAAIRGLGRVGTSAALETLSEAAGSHADPATRRRAAAEVRVLTKGREVAKDAASSEKG